VKETRTKLSKAANLSAEWGPPYERLMKTQALRARPRRRRLPKDDGQRSVIAPITLDRKFNAERPNQRWIADFT
jgi:transposase InsO family protein